MGLLSLISEKTSNHQKQYAVLLDPDDVTMNQLDKVILLAEKAGVDYFFIGGSLITKNNFEEVASHLKSNSSIPLAIFPGSVFQITSHADAILFLSLISGRNPEYLIGQQVQAAPHLANSNLEVIPTAYMLIESGGLTTALYMSSSMPIPSDKPEIAMATAMAGEMMGQKLIYLDGGSGAKYPVPRKIISTVKENVSCPVVVGGGLKTGKDIRNACLAGADIVVTGNIIEKDPTLISSFADTIHNF